MKKSSRLTTALLFAGLGLLLLWLGYGPSRVELEVAAPPNAEPSPEASTAAASSASKESASEVQRLREREVELQQQVALLQRRLASQTNPSAAGAGPTGTNAGTAGGTSGLATTSGHSITPGSLNAAIEQHVETQMARARERLNLTDDQQQQLGGIVRKALEDGRENVRKAIAGEVRAEDLPTQWEWARQLEQEILSTLTPDQQTAYRTYKREDIAAGARLMANGEMLLIQGSLGLSQEQQDQVFAVLYEHATERLDPNAATAAEQPRHPLQAVRWENGRKLKSLEGVLTPGQLEAYRQLQDSYLKLLSGGVLPPGTTTPSGAGK